MRRISRPCSSERCRRSRARRRRRRVSLVEQALQQGGERGGGQGGHARSPVRVCLCRTRNTTNSSGSLFALPRPSMTDRRNARISSPQAAPAGPLGRSRRRRSWRPLFRFWRRKAPSASPRRGWPRRRGQRRVDLPVLPEQGGDPVPAAERRVAADHRSAARHPRGPPVTAAGAAAHPRPRLPPLGMRGGRDAHGARRCGSSLPGRSRGAGGEGVGHRTVEIFMRRRCPKPLTRRARPGRRPDHDDAQRRREAVLGNAPDCRRRSRPMPTPWPTWSAPTSKASGKVETSRLVIRLFLT